MEEVPAPVELLSGKGCPRLPTTRAMRACYGNPSSISIRAVNPSHLTTPDSCGGVASSGGRRRPAIAMKVTGVGRELFLRRGPPGAGGPGEAWRVPPRAAQRGSGDAGAVGPHTRGTLYRLQATCLHTLIARPVGKKQALKEAAR